MSLPMNDELQAFADDIKRHFDATAESLRGIVAEQYLDLKTDLRATREELKAEIVEVRGAVVELTARVDVSVAQLSQRLSTLETDHAALTVRVERIEQALRSQ